MCSYDCSITLALAELPVYALDGKLYGLEAIDTWLAAHGTSPYTRAPMDRIYIRPEELVAGYTAYCQAHGLTVPSLPVGTIRRELLLLPTHVPSVHPCNAVDAFL